MYNSPSLLPYLDKAEYIPSTTTTVSSYGKASLGFHQNLPSYPDKAMICISFNPTTIFKERKTFHFIQKIYTNNQT